MNTPTPNKPTAFRLEISTIEWDALHVKAALSGKTNVQRFLRSELYRFYQENKDIPEPTVKGKRKCRHYEIPAELVGFYAKLAEHLNTDIAKVVYRLIIAPSMVMPRNKNLIIRMIRSHEKSNHTATVAPVFTSQPGVNYNVTPKNQ